MPEDGQERRDSTEETADLRERIRELEREIAERDERDTLVDACLRAAGARLFVQDRNLRYTWLGNPLDGFRAEDVLGRQDEDFFPAEDAAELRAWKSEVLEGGRTLREEMEVRLSGKATTYDIAAAPLRGEDGEVCGIACASWDVTEARRSRDTHLANEERLRHLADLVYEGIAIHRKGELLFVNRTFAEILGQDAHELIGANLVDFAAPESADFAGHRIANPESDPFEGWILRADGERRLLEMAAREIDYYGEDARLLSVRDVTVCRSAETRLRESERTFRTMFDSTPDCVFLKDEDLRYRKVNVAMARLFGKPAEELIGRTDKDLFGEEAAVHIAEMDRRVLAGETVEEIDEKPVGGVMRSFHTIKMPFRDEEDRVTGLCGIARDVTQARESERTLRETQERLSLALRGDRMGVWDWRLESGEIIYTTVHDVGGEGAIRERRMQASDWWERVHPEDRRQVSWAIRDFLQGRIDRYVTEFRYRYGEDRWRWIRNQGEITERDRTGRPVRMTGIHRDVTMEKKAEEAILASEGRYRSLVDHAPVPIIIHAAEKVVYANPAAARTLGTDPDRLIGASIWDFVVEENQQLARKRVKRIYEKGFHEPLVRERFRRPDGTEIDVDVTATGIEFEGMAASQVVFLDVSERIRAERALRESEEKYRLLVGNVNASIILVDREGCFLFVNDVAARSFGTEPEGLIGRRMEEIFPPELARKQLRDVRAVIDSEREMRVRHRTKLGENWHWFDCTLHPYRDAVGRVTGALVIATDITELQESEDDRNRLATAVDHLGESVMITDPKGIIQYVNPAFERMSGYTRDEAVGRTPRILQSGEQDEAFYRDLWSTIGEGRVWRGKLVNRRKNGSLYQTEATISPVKDASGRIVHFVSVKRDVTREVELEARFRQSQKMEAIGTLAGGIAHDFNNLLYAMLGFTEMALDETPEDGKSRVCLEQVRKGGQRAAELVRRILAFSRKDEPDWTPLRVQPVIKEALKLIAGSVPPGVEIRERIDPECGRIRSEPSQIHQIVMNLCGNAFHALRERGGTVTVELEECDGAVPAGKEAPPRVARLVVRDDGPGMDEGTARRAFEPYFTTKEVGEGTGLGLATVHGIVWTHGGEARIESVPGAGTAVIIDLPLAEGGEEKKVAAPCTAADGENTLAGRGERVLFVDDDGPVSELSRLMLEKLGYQAEVFTCGREALERLRSAPDAFDLILTDLVMPGVSGLEVAREAARLRPGLPVLLCTGNASNVSEREAKEVSLAGVIEKPVKRRELAAAIRGALRERTKREVGTGAANTGD